MSYVQSTTTTPKYQAPKGTFKEDLSRAYQLENNLKALIESNHDCIVTTFHGDNSFTDYDLHVEFKDGSPSTTLELKEDKLVSKTGNIAVELGRMAYGEKRDTCLSVSKSDMYVYFFDNAYHFIETSTLKKLVDDKMNNRFVWGGDGGKAYCALLKKDTFIKNSIRVNAE